MDMDMGGDVQPSVSSVWSASLDSGVRLERRSAPTWLKVLLLVIHLVPLVLIAVSSGLFAGIEPASGLVVARALVVLVLIVAVAELVENAVLVPLCARGAKLPSLLLSWRGVALGSAAAWSKCRLCTAHARLLHLLGGRLAAPGVSTHPGREARPLGARQCLRCSSQPRLQSRRSHCL